MSKKIEIEESSQQEQAQYADEQALQEASGEFGEQLEQLSRRVEELEGQRNEFRDMLQRKQAEFENYRKRTLRERDDIRSAARADVLKELLPVLDACEKGLEALPPPNGDPLLEGFQEGYHLLVREIRSLFERFGVEAVPGPGQPFDPNVHEAVMREETDEHQDGAILEEYRKGYQYQDRLLRPSQVKVAVNVEAADPNEEEDEDQSVPARSVADGDGKIDIQA